MRSKLLIGGLGAAVAFLLATSPVVAQAAGFITSGDIVNNTIKSKDVKDNNLQGKDVKDGTLTSGDVADGSLTGGDVADGSLTGGDVADNSLTGTDVNESTLVLPATPAVAEGPVGAAATLTGTQTTYATVSFTAPAAGFVRLQAGASFNTAHASNGYVDAYLYDLATKLQSAWWDTGDNDSWIDNHQTIDAVAPVTAGAHTYTLQLDSFGAGAFPQVYYPQVIVEFFPTGSAPAGPPFRSGQ